MNDGAASPLRWKRIAEGTKDVADRRAIRNAILDGVQVANRRYENWSRGGWLSDSGVEGHVVSTIGEKLHGLIAGEGSIEMEMPFGAIRKWSNARRARGRPRISQNARNRTDIVVLTRERRPICVIEVKRGWDEEKCLWDLVRIRDLILRCGRQNAGTLRAGFLAFLLEGWQEEGMTAEQCLEGEEREIRRVFRDEFDSEGLRMECRRSAIRRWPQNFRRLHDETNWVHAAFCVGLWGGQRSQGGDG